MNLHSMTVQAPYRPARRAGMSATAAHVTTMQRALMAWATGSKRLTAAEICSAAGVASRAAPTVAVSAVPMSKPMMT